MRLSEFDSNDGKAMMQYQLDPRAFQVPKVWTTDAVIEFTNKLSAEIKEVEDYLEKYTDFMREHGKKYRSNLPMNADNRPLQAIQPLIKNLEKILQLIQYFNKAGLLDERGPTEAGKKLLVKMKNDFSRMASVFEKTVEDLKSNPLDLTKLSKKSDEKIKSALSELSKKIPQALQMLTNSIYSAAENI